jgi:hypothetical protein
MCPREAESDVRNALTGAGFSLPTPVGGLVRTRKLREISVADQEKKLFRNLNEPAHL